MGKQVKALPLKPYIINCAKFMGTFYAYETFAKCQVMPMVHMAMDDTGHEIWNDMKLVIQNDYRSEPSEELRQMFQKEYEITCIETFEGIDNGSIDVQAIEKMASEVGITLHYRIQ